MDLLSEALPFMPETAKAVANFGKGATPRELIQAYGEVKLAAVRAQQESASLYPDTVYDRLESVLAAIIRGDYDGLFPLPLIQGGAGTSLHMNLCEAAAFLVNQESEEKDSPAFTVDPLDHLARFQSTNDTFPTAVTVIFYRRLSELEQKIVELQEALVAAERQWDHLLMTGRTQLQSALPMTLGQVFAGWAGSIERDRWRLSKLRERLRQVPLGGTALGTCFSATRDYVFAAERHLKSITGLPLCRSQNLTNAVSAQDHLAEAASGYAQVAANLYKISGDLLLYTSSLSGEIVHPGVQYGSTIMPFKTNPVLLEQIRGRAVDGEYEAEKVRRFCREGQLQLNAYLPFALESFLRLHHSVFQAASALCEKLLPALAVNEERCEQNLVESGALVNALLPRVGYRRLKTVYEKLRRGGFADRRGLIKTLADHLNCTEEQIHTWLDQRQVTSFYKENL